MSADHVDLKPCATAMFLTTAANIYKDTVDLQHFPMWKRFTWKAVYISKVSIKILILSFYKPSLCLKLFNKWEKIGKLIDLH